MVAIYGEQRLVNLVNHKGHEKPVKDAYERAVSEVRIATSLMSYSALIDIVEANVPNVRYEYFDFHTECKKMRFDRVSLLIDKLADELSEQG